MEKYSYVTPEGIYAKLCEPRTYRRVFAVFSSLNLFTYLVFLSWVYADPDSYDNWWEPLVNTSPMLGATLLTSAIQYFVLMRIGRWLFQASTLRDSFRKLRPAPWLYIVPVLLLLSLLAAGMWGIVTGNDLATLIFKIGLALLSIPLAFYALVTSCLLLCYILVGAVVVVKKPFAWLMKGLWWIAEHPKGAWSASVFVATLFLGFVSFLLKF
jgi:hypothetical protein